MNHWDSIRELQRVIRAMDPLRDEIRRMEELHRQMLSNPVLDAIEEIRRRDQIFQDAMAPPLLARDLASEVSRARDALNTATGALPDYALLNASVQPLLDASRVSTELFLASDLVSRLNASINSATFIGELELGQPDDEDADEPITPERVEANLVALASPETVAALRAVEFAPIVALDQVLRQPELMLSMDPRSFEAFVATLVDRLGFDDVTLTPRAGDQGRDVLATKHIHGMAILFAFECKRYSADRPVGVGGARALLGTIVHGSTRANKGVLVTTSRLTRGARSFILTEPALEGRDFDGLVSWLNELKTKDGTA